MVDKVRALELREQGYTFQEIASEIYCSVDWCKRNLKDTGSTAKQRKATDRLIALCNEQGKLTLRNIRDEANLISDNETTRLKLVEKLVARVKDKLNIKSKILVHPPKDMLLKNKYVVYTAALDGKVIYVGSGAFGREKHIKSGCSHIYDLNKFHFEGRDVVVAVLHVVDTKEESLRLEQFSINEHNPPYNKKNCRTDDDNTVIIWK